MEDYKWIFITLIAYILSVIYDLLKRELLDSDSGSTFRLYLYGDGDYKLDDIRFTEN